MQVLSAPRVVAGHRVLSPGAVVVEGDRIAAVLPGRPAAHRDHLRLEHGILAPGLVDLQVNGYGGVDLARAGPEGWARVAEACAATGVTSFLPTFITAPVEALAARLEQARAARAGQTRATATRVRPGARILGVHMEGPFLSPARAGAHDPGAMLDPAPELVDRLLEAGEGILALMTLAPERDGALDAVKRLAGAGVVVSVGHSDATAAEVAAAADAGARKVTHLFNAQRGLGHREPGVAGQGLADPRLTLGLIADLHHVHPAVCQVVLAAAGGRVALVTDATAAAGMPPGRYDLGGVPVELPPEGPPRRADGTIAGSALRLDEAVANAAGLGLGLADAVGAATRVPADLLGRADLGRLAPGALADLVWLGDDLRTLATWVGGARAPAPTSEEA
ncbi:MAG TPA: N-acetylglucosamine-6-phosphate deacetylase [Actinomycetota bacterium]|nr:N-acetylglucosamine-6-phosphate deacetylase [Actinomycetota bacterium]